MSDSATHAAGYCSTLVRSTDEDRWLAAGYAPPETRRRLLALHAFQCELRRIPAAVSEPPLGEIRLQWWREAFEELREGKQPRAHPVVEEIAAADLAGAPLKADIEKVIDAAARPLYGEGFSSADDLHDWLERAEGAFDALAVRVAGGDDEATRAAALGGAAFAMAREGNMLAPHLGDALAQAAAERWRAAKPGVAEGRKTASLAPAVAHLSLTPLYLKRREKPFPLMKRLRLFTVIAAGA